MIREERLGILTEDKQPDFHIFDVLGKTKKMKYLELKKKAFRAKLTQVRNDIRDSLALTISKESEDLLTRIDLINELFDEFHNILEDLNEEEISKETMAEVDLAAQKYLSYMCRKFTDFRMLRLDFGEKKNQDEEEGKNLEVGEDDEVEGAK